MLKLSKKADYGLIALKHLATNQNQGALSAGNIAEVHGISAALMAKVLQRLARSGLVVARHGSGGGYTLARDPSSITALEAISAIDGPLFITSCVTRHGECEHTLTCTVRSPLQRVNDSIVRVLSAVTISQMTEQRNGSAVIELST